MKYHYKAMLESWLEQAMSAEPKFSVKAYGLCYFSREFEDDLLLDPSVTIDRRNSPQRILEERLVETLGPTVGPSGHPFHDNWEGYADDTNKRAQHRNAVRIAWVRKELELLA